jgi:hypothetical protein
VPESWTALSGRGAADLFGGHRAENNLPRLQRADQPRIPDGVIIEIGAHRHHHERGPCEIADRGDELASLSLVWALCEDRFQLVHDDRRARRGDKLSEVVQRLSARLEDLRGLQAR